MPFYVSNFVAIIQYRRCQLTSEPRYIYAESSRARLRVTRSMLVEVLTFHQVMPDYLEFLFIFGLQSEPRDLGFGSFRQHMSLKPANSKFAVPSLGRTGRNYQLCYNLKGVTCKYRNPEDLAQSDYSIRQAAIYHKFDASNGSSLWIVTKGGLDLNDRFKKLTGKDARPEDKSFGSVEECFKSSLSAHLLFCHWATEDWRGYIKWLEEVVDQEASPTYIEAF